MTMGLEDVVKLIEACKNAGVSRIKWNKLDVTFHEQSQPTAPGREAIPQVIQSRAEIEREIEEDPDLNDLEFQTLMITDPEAFEDYVRKAEHAQVHFRSQRDVHAE